MLWSEATQWQNLSFFIFSFSLWLMAVWHANIVRPVDGPLGNSGKVNCSKSSTKHYVWSVTTWSSFTLRALKANVLQAIHCGVFALCDKLSYSSFFSNHCVVTLLTRRSCSCNTAAVVGHRHFWRVQNPGVSWTCVPLHVLHWCILTEKTITTFESCLLACLPLKAWFLCVKLFPVQLAHYEAGKMKPIKSWRRPCKARTWWQ